MAANWHITRQVYCDISDYPPAARVNTARPTPTLPCPHQVTTISFWRLPNTRKSIQHFYRRCGRLPLLQSLWYYTVTSKKRGRPLSPSWKSVLNLFPTKQINKHFPGESGEIHLLIYFPFSIATDDKRLVRAGGIKYLFLFVVSDDTYYYLMADLQIISLVLGIPSVQRFIIS